MVDFKLKAQPIALKMTTSILKISYYFKPPQYWAEEKDFFVVFRLLRL